VLPFTDYKIICCPSSYLKKKGVTRQVNEFHVGKSVKYKKNCNSYRNTYVSYPMTRNETFKKYSSDLVYGLNVVGEHRFPSVGSVTIKGE